ncbi:MAG: thiamine pyrophosphate-binding protein [Candidatus Parabeggiatoa sp. nov. 3]|nr:MAG: thiamine pyrophosphate-binding protein [Gammaproteobacteria bacterium]RKZ59544.1 MAG: thiamine pyrophosphate-binding protein [Gammaproteobacteria bacterium]RKZ73964.1 MAG: thiamine pyrophosphate-binding protein [Gammaproteobacteria bacterium]
MLNTTKFLEQLSQKGYSHFCVVPCSFAKNLINAAINNDKIEYIPAANEAIACSIAAGLKMSGKKPLVIVQSSGLTNMGSCITSLLKPYNIHIAIIVSWRTYQAGDSEIQHQHLATELPKLIAAYGATHEILAVDDLNHAIAQIEESHCSNKILTLKKDTFSPVALDKKHQLDLSNYSHRSQFLQILNQRYRDSDYVFIGTTGHTAREMFSVMPNTKNFYMAGNMGGALSIGLGAYVAGKNVIVCGGDAEFVMHLGGLTTAGRYTQSPGVLIYIVFDNESNKSTGKQNTYQKHINYLGIAQNAHLAIYPETVLNKEQFKQALSFAEQQSSPVMIHVKCSYDDVMPRASAEKIQSSQEIFIHET